MIFSDQVAHLMVDVEFGTDQRLLKPLFDLTNSQVLQTCQSHQFGGIGSAGPLEKVERLYNVGKAPLLEILSQFSAYEYQNWHG